MAGQYLQRNPTNTGNRKVHTWSGWVKQNKANTTASNNIWYVASAGNSEWRIYITNQSNLVVTDYTPSGGSVMALTTERFLRDHGSWFHLLVSVDTTNSTESERMRIYIDGVRLTEFSATNYGPQNHETRANTVGEVNYLGQNTVGGATYQGFCELFDVFSVDGQALTPDVFGFYKDGDGYQSSGTSRATDFRSGQWSPRLPKSIKHTINRGGGFGVNGFYLPMNDSSDFGADFHCTPNSIIKLKGEDEPQPRNGAPTTSDSFVSQLRDDPFAANLVLAVPGISNPIGSNLISNGTFDTNTTGWNSLSSATLSVVNGRLRVTNSIAAYGKAEQEITTEAGKRYIVSLDSYTGTTTDEAQLRVGSTSNGSDLLFPIDVPTGHHTVSFTATGTSSYINVNPGGNVANEYSEFDNIVVKEEDGQRDYSADIKGSGTNKTLTASGNAGVSYDLGGYYGSALTFDGTGDVLSVSNNSDFNFSDGSDFTIELWLYRKDTAGNDGIIGIFENTAGTRRTWQLEQRANQAIRFEWWSDGSSGTNITTDNDSVPIDQWSHICAERSGSRITLYVNGVVAGMNTSAGSIYDNTVDPLRIGAINQSITAELNANIQDIRIYKGLAKYKGGFDVPRPFCPKGIDSWRQVSDTCKNNFATLNPLASRGTHTNGNLTAAPATNVAYSASISNFMVSSGKWYCELRCDENSTGGIITGISELENLGFRDIFGGSNFFGQSIEANDTAGVRSAVGGADGDIISMYMDLDSSPITCSFAVNGGSATTYTSDNLSYNYNNLIPGRTYGFAAADAQSGTINIQFTFNFGQNPTFCGQTTAGTFTDSNGKGLFKYEPPTGFLALCDDNLPTPAVADPGEYFKTVLWTGDGDDNRSITKVGFKPDFVWIKERSSTSTHALFDSVRGAGLRLVSSTDAAEDTGNENVYNPSFNSNGFTVGTDGAVNQDGQTYVAWCWKAGGPAVSNADGNITSQVSVNQTAGFSIVSYTGTGSATTVGHGLGKTPAMIIIKGRSNAYNWNVWHESLNNPTTHKLYLDTTDIENDGGGSGTGTWNSTLPTSTVFSLGSFLNVNQGSNTFIAYCWAEIEGYSKFGSYTGNNDSTNGPFAYCGFKPAWLLLKCISAADGNWILLDSSRSSENVNGLRLGANLGDSENQNDTNLGVDSSVGVDFLSNGFKIKTSGVNHNGDGEKYIFAAFAESPFQTANAK